MLHLETTSRQLEQYFYMHGIRFTSFYKNQEHLTVWRYSLDDYGQRVLALFQEMTERKKAGGKKE